MGHYIGADGNYYSGQRIRRQDVEVPRRPSAYHNWDGSDWIEDTVKKSQDEDLVALDKMIQDEIKEIAINSLKSKGLIK